MTTKAGESSQSWLSGVDNTLENFFRGGGAKLKLKVKGGAGSGGGSKTGLGVKRKRASGSTKSIPNASDESPAKKLRLSPSKDADANGSSHLADPWLDRRNISPSKGNKPKVKERKALGDLTSTLQNSPHRRRATTTAARSRFRPGTHKKSEVNGGTLDSEDNSSDPEVLENDVPLRLRASRAAETPHRSLQIPTNRGKIGTLPTPPSSGMPPSRTLTRDRRHGSSCGAPGVVSSNRKGDNVKDAVDMQIPFTFSKETGAKNTCYPTPTSVVVPRLRLVPKGTESSSPPLGAPDLRLDSGDSNLTSLVSSSPECSQVDEQVDKEKGFPCAPTRRDGKQEGDAPIKADNAKVKDTTKDKGKWKMYTAIPSSQTQYIHYSPTKKRTYDFPVRVTKKLQGSSLVIPCSQPLTSSPSSSQLVIELSPRTRKLGKPRPITTPRGDGTGSALNFVVPTSQDDEKEISIFHGTGDVGEPSLSLPRSVTECVSADEASGGTGNARTGIQVRSKSDLDQSSQQDGEPSSQTDDLPLIQSSVTEPDSQCDEDPFSLTNEAYLRHLTLHEKSTPQIPSRDLIRPSVKGIADSRDLLTCTQSSVTQTDDDDEDPFPGLPPPSAPVPTPTPTPITAPSSSTPSSALTATRTTAAGDKLSEPTCYEVLKGNRLQESSQTQPDSETESERESVTEPDSESQTQPDSQEEDFAPFPPPSATPNASATATPSATATAINTAYHPTVTQNDDCVNYDNDYDEAKEEDEVSTLDLRRMLGMDMSSGASVNTTIPYRIRLGRNPKYRSGEEAEVDEDEETMPTPVREFLAMFSQSQSHDCPC